MDLNIRDKKFSLKMVGVTALAVFVVVLSVLYIVLFSAPSDFSPQIIYLRYGQGAQSISKQLTAAHVVRSSIMLRSAIILLGGERNVTAGAYEFDSRQNVFTIAYRVIHGKVGYIPTKITIPEGTDNAEIGVLVHATFPQISEEEFAALVKGKEGFLFPDTYFFPPFARAEDIVTQLEGTFDDKIAPYQDQIKASGHSLNEIITMASILEQEVKTDADRKMVAGILWHRIDIGMRLQVDSTLTYILGKTSKELTSADLHNDSSYNTYIHTGLPPGPIANPGLVSINAALNPTPNDYIYFLSDKNGITHFSVTLKEHADQINTYLK